MWPSIIVALALPAAPALADPDYDADVSCFDDERCGAEFVGAPEPPRLGLPSMLTTPNDGRMRSGRLLPPAATALRVPNPRSAPHIPSPYEFGPRLKADLAGTSLDINLGFNRAAAAPQATPPTDLRYQWQLRAPLLSDLDVGLQGSGELGPWSQPRPIGEVANRYGVTLFGLSRPDGGGFGWQAGYASGSAFGRDGYLFSGSVKYGF